MAEAGVERAVFLAELAAVSGIPEGFSRLYLGAESCRGRLPDVAELRRAREAASARGMLFTLVTPPLDEAGLGRAVALAAALPDAPGTEIVLNDFGLLEALAGTRRPGALVIGRLLTRQRRGPGFRARGTAAAEQLAACRASLLDAEEAVRLLRERYGVARYELDDIAQGIALPPLPPDVRVSLHRPHLLVTLTRHCPWTWDGRGWGGPDECGRPCRGRSLRLEPREEGAPLLLAACAQYLRAEGDRPPPPPVDRLVWQEGIPA